MLTSDWVRAEPPADLLPVDLGTFSLTPGDTGPRVERAGARLFQFESPQVECAARADLLACTYTDGHDTGAVLIGADATISGVRTNASFFDSRAVVGPPRWTPDGQLWLRIGDAWERRPVIEATPGPPTEKERLAAEARIRAALPSDAGAFTRAGGDGAVAALQSEPLAPAEAYALWRRLDRPGFARAVIDLDLTEPERGDRAWHRAFAEQVPPDAVLAQLERDRLAFRAEAVRHAQEYGFSAFDAWSAQRGIAAVRAGGPTPLDPEPAGEPSFLWTEAAPHPLRVLVVEGPDELLPIATGFGAFNACPSPGEHAVLLHDWRERYGARVLYLDHDVLELEVARPERDPRAAYELGYQLLVYDGDLESLESAAKLATARRWAFWWD